MLTVLQPRALCLSHRRGDVSKCFHELDPRKDPARDGPHEMDVVGGYTQWPCVFIHGVQPATESEAGFPCVLRDGQGLPSGLGDQTTSDSGTSPETGGFYDSRQTVSDFWGFLFNDL